MIARRVLIVDEDTKILRLLEATLRLKDLDVAKAETAAQALRWLKANQPDLIISDTDVSDLDGFDFYRRVRAMPRHVDVPFMFLSAQGEPEDVARGLRAGADEYLRKPFAIDELLVRVLRVLGNQRLATAGGGAAPLTGSLSEMSVPDLLRMLSVQRTSGLARVEVSGQPAPGLLGIEGGRVVHAEFGLLDGIPALFALLPFQEGRFSFDPAERLAGDSVGGETLPLLMEGFRLLDSGLLRRIDPRNLQAARAFRHLVGQHRRKPLDESSSDVSPLRLQDGRRPGVVAEGVALDSLDSVEFRETQAFAALSRDEELPSEADLGMDDIGLDTSEYAAAFLTGEIEALEAEIEGRHVSTQPILTIEEAEDDRRVHGRIVISAPQAPPDDDDDVFAVALVDDTIAEMHVDALMSASVTGSSPDVMGFYEAIKGVAKDVLGADSIQLGTRSGRVIASSIPQVTRRDTVAAFSSQAIMFAAEGPGGTPFASLDAGDLHVVVIEIDHLRLLTLLFGVRPEPASCVAALATHLDDYRASR